MSAAGISFRSHSTGTSGSRCFSFSAKNSTFASVDTSYPTSQPIHMIMLTYVIPTFNSGNKIQILPLNYNPTTCLNLSTAADVYSVVRHIVRRESRRTRESINKLTDRTLWQPRHPLHRIMLNCSSDNLISLYIHTVCTVCHIICTACYDAITSILHVVHCKELQAVQPCLLVGVYKFCHLDHYCCCVTDTELFLYFFPIDCCYHCFSDSCVTVDCLSL